MKFLGLLLVLGLTCVVTRAEAPFREEVEYRYDMEASMTTESLLSSEYASLTFITAQLFIQASFKDGVLRAVFRMNRIEAAVQHGINTVPDISHYKYIKELSDHLSKPFYVRYDDTKVSGISFPNQKEPVWSHNFKRSIASNFQVRQGSGSYQDEELTLNGRCSVDYFSHKINDGEYIVNKDRNFDSCSNSIGRNRTFIHLTGHSSASNQQRISSSTASSKISIVSNRRHPEFIRIESIWSLWLDPFTVAPSIMKTSTNMTAVLKKVRRSVGVADKLFPQDIVFEDSLDFVYGHQYDGIDQSTIDLKAPQNLMLHPEAIILDQEKLRHKSLLDIIQTVENLEATSSERRIDMNRVGLSSISFQLGSLDYNSAMILFKELTFSDNNDKLFSAKNIFLDLLLHSGSNVALVLLRDIIHSGDLDGLTAARLVSFSGVFVKHPTEKLLLEFKNVGDYKKDDESFTTMHNAAILAVASLVSKTCGPQQPPCKQISLSQWQRDYYNKVKGESLSFPERALYVHALHNLGYEAVLDDILASLTDNIPKENEKNQDLKVYIIKGLAAYSKQTAVQNSLLDLLRDPNGNFRVKIAAAAAYMYYPSVEVLTKIRFIITKETNVQVRQFLISTLQTMATTHNPTTQHLKEMAQQILNTIKKDTITTSIRSAEYAFDVMEKSAGFGSQLNIKTTAGEFDDIPSFVDGKVIYFLQGHTIEPFGISDHFQVISLDGKVPSIYVSVNEFEFTLRSSGLRRYISELTSSTLRQEDLNLSRMRTIMKDFEFAGRREHSSSMDITFKLHGRNIMFYHLDQNMLKSSMKSARNLEILQDMTLNLQRYAVTGAILNTQPNGLGFPVSQFFSAPLLISLKGSISKIRTTKGLGRDISLNIYGEIYGDHGILAHVSPFNMSQGVVRNRKAIFNVPLKIKFILKDKQFDLTYANQVETNPLELASLARTVLIQRPCQGSEQILNEICPKCNPLIIVRRASSLLKSETIANLTTSFVGTEAHGQVFECDSGRSAGKQLTIVLNALSPVDMNFGNNMAGWAYLSFIRLQHFLFIQPDGRHCGYRGRIFKSSHLPVTEVFIRMKLKATTSDDPEKAWQASKFGMRIDSNWRGETAASDRKGEVDISFEYKGAGALNMFNIRVITDSSPLVDIKDNIICLRAESNFQVAPPDIIDISVYSEPPSAKGNIDFVMGVPSPSNRNQCPTNQFRFKTTIEAQAGDWVMLQRDEGNSWPYKKCNEQKKAGNWANGLTPQTEACYLSALHFTTLSDYKMEFLLAAVPERLTVFMERVVSLITLSLYSYLELETVENMARISQDYRYLQLNATILPEKDEGNQITSFSYSTGNKIKENFNRVTLPSAIYFDLPSTSIPRATRFAYDNKLFPSCMATSNEISTLDETTYAAQFTSCYSLISSDCGSDPLYGVFVRRTNGVFSLAVKVHVGGHTIEIIPDESNRRKEFTVKANDIEIPGDSYLLPEGLKRFFVLKVRYQAPMYIISSPGIGLLVHYSGSHVTVHLNHIHRQQHCGLCGDFDGEVDEVFYSPKGCATRNTTQLLASYTLGDVCFSQSDRVFC